MNLFKKVFQMDWDSLVPAMIQTSIERQIDMAGHAVHYPRESFIAEIGLVGMQAGRQVGATQAAARWALRTGHTLVTIRDMRCIIGDVSQFNRVVMVPKNPSHDDNIHFLKKQECDSFHTGLILDGSSLFGYNRIDTVRLVSAILRAQHHGWHDKGGSPIPVVMVG